MDDAAADACAAVLSQVAAVYHFLLEENGLTPEGVGWSSAESQEDRFRILCSAMDPVKPLVVNDVGCGLGSLFPYLDKNLTLSGYVGLDICESMVEAARTRIQDPRAAFIQNAVPLTPAHWCLASGTFNISGGADAETWRGLIREVLTRMAGFALTGIAFNMLRPHRRDDLIWGDEPEQWEALCRHILGGAVERIEHEGGEEWTLIARRP